MRIVGHTEYSRTVHPAGLGEIDIIRKFGRLMDRPSEVHDIYQLFGEGPLWKLYKGGRRPWRLPKPLRGEAAPTILWTCEWVTQALLRLPWRRGTPLITHDLLCHHQDDLPVALHQQSTLLFGISLLTPISWLRQGMPRHRVLYLPQSYVPMVVEARRDLYLDELERSNQKGIPPDAFLVGCVSRFTKPKNIDGTLRVMEEVCRRRPHVRFVLKGDYDASFDAGTDYTARLKEQIDQLIDAPWFFWDRTRHPHPDALARFATFDLALHLSRHEASSGTCVDYCALGLPLVLLNTSTNPYTFNGAAQFIQPDLSDAVQTIIELIDDEERRTQLGQAARAAAEARFHPRFAREKGELMLAAALDPGPETRDRLEAALEEDFKVYGINL